MKKLSGALAILIAYLGMIFSGEVLGFWRTNSVQIHALVYMMIFVSILALLLLPTVQRFSLAVIIPSCAAIYLSARWAAYPKDALLGGINSYQTIVELVLLAVAVYLSWSVSRLYYQVEAAVENALMPEANVRVHKIKNMAEEIKTEITRSRRYNHLLSILVVEPTQGTLRKNMQAFLNEVCGKLTRRFISNNLKEVISRQARRTDIILSHNQEDRFYILCPENDPSSVMILAKRVETELRETLGISISFGVASFPTDALTFEDLILKAENSLKSYALMEAHKELDVEPMDARDSSADAQ